jgi:SAM-dependent methyltransferase
MRNSLARIGTTAVLAIFTTIAMALVTSRALGAEPDAASPEQKQKSREARIPKGPQRYKGREIAETMHYLGAPWLMRDERQREEDCAMLLEALQLKPGQAVCDMGCGNGFYTLQLARIVGPEGRVLAVDIQPEMLHLLEARAIELIEGSAVDPKLPDEELDLVLMVDVYHEFSHPEQMLKAIRRSLKPSGRIALGEFRLEDPNVPIKLLHKMSKKQILREYQPNGFELIEQFDKLPWQHLMFFERSK